MNEWEEIHRKADAIEGPPVRALGNAIGYGRLMQLAEKLWREKLAETGLEGGEHTIGPCATFMVRCPHTGVDAAHECEWCCGSGRVTKKVLWAMGEISQDGRDAPKP